ncbi:pilus assembly protein [Luteimonas sp. SJ-92]|uniref:Pilus assembly protein n=1 Tax=Luteimonas salinisoli TaxID=2752307 RepID=A0A853JC06_9GAMM|nr:PilX N-terminal domain-containing pilus assembly protein [Luteimonas salinisoli]NZA26302.1 pilus assembly protein [Luteimonas salinisoli]
MNRPVFAPRHGSARAQSGAVLYIALIMLVLLALIGIVGMQVAGMQERMSANYRAVNIAFQNAEGVARQTECAIEDLVNRTVTAGCAPVNPSQVCDDGFDPLEWASERDMNEVTTINTRLIGPCISGNTSLDMGRPVNEDPNPIYQITAFATDEADLDPLVGNPRPEASSAAAIDTIFRP